MELMGASLLCERCTQELRSTVAIVGGGPLVIARLLLELRLFENRHNDRLYLLFRYSSW